MKKMNLLMLVLLVFASSCGSEARAIDDVDNSIEIKQPQPPHLLARTRLGQDWIKLSKVPPLKIVQKFGSPVEIVCEAIGSPLPILQWVVGQMPLSELESLESNVISESTANTIAKVRSVHIVDHMLSEPRTYTCVGRSGSKTVYASTIVYPQADVKDLVQVQEKPFMGQVKPRIVYHERLHLELEGANLLLPCKVHARPEADVFWMKNGGILIEQNQHYKLLPTGDLLIADLEWRDMGTYKCIARNTFGKDTADVFIYPVVKDKNN